MKRAFSPPAAIKRGKPALALQRQRKGTPRSSAPCAFAEAMRRVALAVPATATLAGVRQRGTRH
jgi:hypothetical protein